MTTKEIRFQLAEQIEKLGYTGCANQIRANLKARDNALSALKMAKAKPELLQMVKQMIPQQTEKQDHLYYLFDISLNNELFHMYTGYGYINAEEFPINKVTASDTYKKLKQELLSLVKPSDELNVLFSQYEQTAKEEYSIYSKVHEIDKENPTRKQYIESVIPLHEQAKKLEKLKVDVKIKLANYLFDNII